MTLSLPEARAGFRFARYLTGASRNYASGARRRKLFVLGLRSGAARCQPLGMSRRPLCRHAWRIHRVSVSLPPRVKIAGVAAGVDHSLARTTTGLVLAWGNNSDGELGDDSASNSSVPVQVRLPAGTKVTSVKGGCYDSLALTSTGRVLAWGLNSFGELGDGTRRSSGTAVRVRPPRGVRVTAISAGCFFNLALTASGEVLAWGCNYGGSLGDSNLNATSPIPVRVRLRPGIRVTSCCRPASRSRRSAGARTPAWRSRPPARAHLGLEPLRAARRRQHDGQRHACLRHAAGHLGRDGDRRWPPSRAQFRDRPDARLGHVRAAARPHSVAPLPGLAHDQVERILAG